MAALVICQRSGLRASNVPPQSMQASPAAVRIALSARMSQLGHGTANAAN